MSSSMKSLLLLAMIVSIVALYSKVDASPIVVVDESNADVDPLAEIDEVNSNLSTFLKHKNTFQHRDLLNAQSLRHKRGCSQMCTPWGCTQVCQKKRQVLDASPVATVEETNSDVDPLAEIEEVNSNLNTFRNYKRDFCRTDIQSMSKFVTSDRCNNSKWVAEECSNNKWVEKSDKLISHSMVVSRSFK